jgi:transcriptional adapter 2-alpha
MRIFARFNSLEDHEQLVQGIIREKQIRQRIEELKEFKKKGFKTLAEVEEELENKRKKDEKIKRKGEERGQTYNYDPNKVNNVIW